MKNWIALAFCLITVMVSQAQDLDYYFPAGTVFNPAVPKPKEVIHHNVGEWHITHDRLVNYMEALARAVPQRIKLEKMGYTYEHRPQVLLIITSPENHKNLEQIRQQHLQLTDPKTSASLQTQDMPVVVYIGHSIHGNEASGSNAALLSAYYLAAAQGKEVEEWLKNVVILFDPSFNPDGLQRFSTWVNQHKSKNLVSDPSSREYNEVWPGGRFNHYWFDLNRDWLPAQHVESRNRLAWFHKWKPNVLTDHHEQGSNATFFFQPGVPSRVNPLTPEKNQELTAAMGRFHAKALDKIGSLYFTRENYDDFYYGKGSTYPDINGAIGILFEQASSRGHLQETKNGLLSFPFTIKNQLTTTLSTIEAANALRNEMLNWQRDFYKSAINEAAGNPAKAFVFGGKNEEAKTNMFAEMLQRHQVEFYRPAKSINTAGKNFSPSDAYIVPLQQPQYRLIRTIFEQTFEYKDSLFYDITSWTMPLAFGINYAELKQPLDGLLGSKVNEVIMPQGKMLGSKSEIGYVMNWNQFYAPAALYQMQVAGLQTKVASNKFTLSDGNAQHDYGTILIPVSMQTATADSIFARLSRIAREHHVEIKALKNAEVTEGSDIGSSRFVSLTKPSVAMLVGSGVNATDAGEIWHLLDQRFALPLSHIDVGSFNRVNLDRYNTLLMVGGSGYAELNKDKLKSWVQAGGTLVLLEEAVSWAAQNGISTVQLKKTKSATDSSKPLPYVLREQLEGAQSMSGVILKANVDVTHPLAYGYQQPDISLFKANKVFMEKSKNPFANPFYYDAKPLQSGWMSKENAVAVANTAAVIVNTLGGGRVISISENPNFRAFWLGGSKLMMNAIFFGRLIDAGSARAED